LSVKIRRGMGSDSDIICKLADQLIHLDDRRRRSIMLHESFIDQRHDLFVAETGEKVVGFVETLTFPDLVEGFPIAIIQNLVVDKENRRKGVGNELLAHAIEKLRGRGVKELHAWTDLENEPAMRLYLKHGFIKRAFLLEKEI